MEAFGGLAGIGALMAGLGFAFAQFKAGGNKAKDELIATLKETAVAEREKAAQLAQEKNIIIASHQTQINSLNEKIGKLQGLYEAAEQRNKEYLSILQGRAPEQTEFMKFVTTVATNHVSYMKETSVILKDVKEFMEHMKDNGYVMHRVVKSTKGRPVKLQTDGDGATVE